MYKNRWSQWEVRSLFFFSGSSPICYNLIFLNHPYHSWLQYSFILYKLQTFKTNSMRHRRLWWNELCYSPSKKMTWKEGIFLSARLGSMPVVSSFWMLSCQWLFSKVSFCKLIQYFNISISLKWKWKKITYLNLGHHGTWKSILLYASLTKIKATDPLVAFHFLLCFS